MYSIKPIDEKQIDDAMRDTKFIMTVEDHNIIGGLGGAVSEYVSEKGGFPVHRYGINDHFGRSGTADDLFKLYGLTSEDVAKKITSLL